ncbi:uncharacterized protein LOC123300876 isoform X2 [Chrysoperla carnea]|uniref:uncharacterized protein LOC123300876 isoform X2 n=1 Tax=Chrysoperla carnea TaxID=189513 RepID=UPI001D08DBF1|nr:uncharacterized protein LOC123300876 isoform X2 [Chrysoperla carnea]
MGCGPSKGNTNTIASVGNGNANPDNDPGHNEVIPPPVAFVVPLDEESGETPALSEGLPAPPPRIQRLLEDAPKAPPSPSRIERKLASAERRRQQILQQRAGSTMSGKERFQSLSIDEDTNEEPSTENGIKTPTENTTETINEEEKVS